MAELTGKPRRETYIDKTRLLRTLEGLVKQGTGAELRNLARQYVAYPGHSYGYAKGDLQNSIQMYAAALNGDVYVYAATPYALAQEFGMPSGWPYPYRFTPYMGPAARDVAGMIGLISKRAFTVAAMGARV